MKFILPTFAISLMFSTLSVASYIEEDGRNIKRAQQSFENLDSKGKNEESDLSETIPQSSKPSGEEQNYIDTMICMVPANQGLFSGLEF